MISSSSALTTVRRHLLRPLIAAGIAVHWACSGAHVHDGGGGSAMDRPSPASAVSGDQAATHARDVERVRAVTASFRVLDSAVAAGYARNVPNCIQNQPAGAMGFHHVNRALLDDKVDLEHPEMLIYERTSQGEYKLNGVEYIVPYRSIPRDGTPPTVFGQKLKPSDSLNLWYLHVWVWQENPSGLFADWNPTVKC